MSLNSAATPLDAMDPSESSTKHNKTVSELDETVSPFSMPSDEKFAPNTPDTIKKPRKGSPKSPSTSKKSNGTGQRRLKSQRKLSPSSSATASSLDISSPSSPSLIQLDSFSRGSTRNKRDNGSGEASDEDSPFLPNFAESDGDLEAASLEQDINMGYQSENSRQGSCFCIRGLVELLKILSFSYINFALIFVPFPVIVFLADWNRGILFILSYITLYPITTFLSSVLAVSSKFFPSWISVVFQLLLRNSLAIMIGSIAVHRSLERIVQGMLVGLLIHRLFLMLGLSVAIASSRSKSIRVDEKNVRVATSLLYMAVIIMELPSFFRLSSPDSGSLGLLKISRWCAVFLLFLLIFFLLYSLRTESKFWISTDQTLPQLRVHPITAVITLLVGLGSAAMSSWFFVISSSWVNQNWGLSYTFIAGIMLPMALNAADFTTSAKLAFSGNIKSTTLGVIKASLEVCLLTAPVLVLGGWISAKLVGLAFFGLVAVSGLLAVVNLGLLLSALKVNWLQGMMMVIAYLLMAVSFFLQNE